MLDEDRHIPVRVSRAPARPAFARGGLVSAAKEVAGAGRMGDSMVVHINKREFEEMMARWGEPTINPDTGLPEFFLGDLWDSVKDWVAPVGGVLAGAFLPGIGEAIGTYLPGVGSLLGPVGTQALGAGLLGAGVGGLTNGVDGAILGGLGGIGGAFGADVLNSGSLASMLGAGAAVAPSQEAASYSVSPSQQSSGFADLFGGNNLAPAVLAGGANLLGSILGSGDDAAEAAEKANRRAQADFNKPLPVYQNKRKRIAYSSVPDYTQEGEREYFENNQFADGGQVRYAGGGLSAAAPAGVFSGYVTGPGGGRDDTVEALLSNNEFVVDAEVVSMLGDGSPEAGAERLEEMRMAVRKHKGSALSAGGISPDALHPLEYLGAA